MEMAEFECKGFQRGSDSSLLHCLHLDLKHLSNSPVVVFLLDTETVL